MLHEWQPYRACTRRRSFRFKLCALRVSVASRYKQVNKGHGRPGAPRREGAQGGLSGIPCGAWNELFSNLYS